MVWEEVPGGIRLAVKVIPKASRSEIAGWEGEELRVRLAAVPEKGQANDELVRFLSKLLKVSKSRIVVMHGEHSRHKKLLLQGVTSAILREHFP